jgi:photosystem II stability/assembly factor-like uncharacterized protein
MTDVKLYPKLTARQLRKMLTRFALPLSVFAFLTATTPALAETSLMMPRASEAMLLDAVRAGDRLLVAGDHGHILYSDDEGDTWQQAKVPTRRALTALSFPDPARGWAVGHDGLILATIDAGESWVIQRDGLKAQQKINEEAVRRARGQVEANKEALLASENAEQIAELQEIAEELELDLEDAEAVLEEAINAPPLLDVYFIDEMHGFAVGAFNTLLQTADGGVEWQLGSALLDNPDEYHLNAITGDERGRLWIAAEGGLLYRSEEAGSSWDQLETPYHGSWFGIIHAPASDTLVAFGLRGNVFRSEDAGDSWLRIETNSDRTLAGGVFINNRYALLVGAVGTLLVSDDSARTFRQIASGTRLPLSSVASIAGTALLVGQGGVHRASPFGSPE